MEKTLLLVADENTVLRPLCHLLRETGYQIHTAEGAVEAMLLLAEQPVAVVLADYRIPGISGDRFLREVQQRYPETVRLLLGDYAEMSPLLAALSDGVIFKSLVKPWDNGFLLSQLAEAFQHWQQMQARQALSELPLGTEVASFELDPNGRVLQLNAQAASHCDGDPARAQGRLLTELFPALSDSELQYLLHPEGCRLALHNRQGRPVELHSHRVSGDRWQLLLTTPTSDDRPSSHAMGLDGLMDEGGLKAALQQLTQLETRSVFALVYLEIRDFRTLTAPLSAQATDQLLRTVAQTLLERRQSERAVAWLGQGQFVLLERSMRTVSDVRRCLAEQLAPFTTPLRVGSQTLSIPFSAGYAIYPDDSPSLAELTEQARQAQCYAQRRGGQYFPRFQPWMALDSALQAELVDEFHAALEQNQLVACYRPEIHLLDGVVLSLTACPGWQHPRFGLILPEQLYPIIQQCGLAAPVTAWMQGMAQLQTELWCREGLPVVPVTVSLAMDQTHASLAQCLRRCSALFDQPAAGWAVWLSHALLSEEDEGAPLLTELRATDWQWLAPDWRADSEDQPGEVLPGWLERWMEACAVAAPAALNLAPARRDDLSVAEARRLSFVTDALPAAQIRRLLVQAPLVSVSVILSMEAQALP